MILWQNRMNTVNNGPSERYNERTVPMNLNDRNVPMNNEIGGMLTRMALPAVQYNVQNKAQQNNFQEMNDIGFNLNDLSTPDELKDFPSNCDHLDTDELIRNLQSSENIWANEWSTATMPVMNIS